MTIVPQADRLLFAVCRSLSKSAQNISSHRSGANFRGRSLKTFLLLCKKNGNAIIIKMERVWVSGLARIWIYSTCAGKCFRTKKKAVIYLIGGGKLSRLDINERTRRREWVLVAPEHQRNPLKIPLLFLAAAAWHCNGLVGKCSAIAVHGWNTTQLSSLPSKHSFVKWEKESVTYGGCFPPDRLSSSWTRMLIAF